MSKALIPAALHCRMPGSVLLTFRRSQTDESDRSATYNVRSLLSAGVYFRCDNTSGCGSAIGVCAASPPTLCAVWNPDRKDRFFAERHQSGVYVPPASDFGPYPVLKESPGFNTDFLPSGIRHCFQRSEATACRQPAQFCAAVVMFHLVQNNIPEQQACLFALPLPRVRICLNIPASP